MFCTFGFFQRPHDRLGLLRLDGLDENARHYQKNDCRPNWIMSPPWCLTLGNDLHVNNATEDDIVFIGETTTNFDLWLQFQFQFHEFFKGLQWKIALRLRGAGHTQLLLGQDLWTTMATFILLYDASPFHPWYAQAGQKDLVFSSQKETESIIVIQLLYIYSQILLAIFGSACTSSKRIIFISQPMATLFYSHIRHLWNFLDNFWAMWSSQAK